MSRLNDGKSWKERPMAFMDFETTGTTPHQVDVSGRCPFGQPSAINFQCGEICEIGVVLVDRPTLTVIRELDCKVRIDNPHGRTESALNFNQYNAYTVAGWTDALPLREAMEQFVDITRGATPHTWNASFERIFAEHAAGATSVELSLDHHWVCVMSQAMMVLEQSGLESFSLDSVSAHLGLPKETKPHRGIAGARQEFEVYKRLRQLTSNVLVPKAVT